MKYKYIGKTNIKASEIGFGASIFTQFFNDSNFTENEESIELAKSIIKTAISLGINYFDVAPWYGNAEYILSSALKEHKRESYYLATKVGRYNSDKSPNEWFDFSYKRTIDSVENSLRLFECDYIDLVQVHDFEFCPDLKEIIEETLPALQELKDKGKIKYIGINSYVTEKLKELLEISPIQIDTVLSYSHLTLDDTSLVDYAEYFRSKNVGIINAAPLSMGLYSPQGAPDWHRAPKEVKEAAKSAIDYCKSNGVSLPKLALNFSATQNLADLTVVSMSSVEIVKENVKALDELSSKEKEVLEYIRNKFFKPLNYSGYGDADVKLFNSQK